MQKVLYLVTRNISLSQDPLFPSQPDPNIQPEMVLLEEGVRIRLDLLLDPIPVSALKDDLQNRAVVFTGNTIGYEDLVEKIFSADTIITL
jgi:hypothetical protein